MKIVLNDSHSRNDLITFQTQIPAIFCVMIQIVTDHQPCWWFDVGPTGPVLLFRLKAVRQTIAYYWWPLKSGSLPFSFHSVSLILLGYILHDCFFVYFTDCLAIISSCPEMTVLFLPILWVAVEYHQCAFTFYSSYSIWYAYFGRYWYIHVNMIRHCCCLHYRHLFHPWSWHSRQT